MRKIIIPALAAFSLGISATPATADTVTVTATASVNFDDLDLTNPSDLAKLEKRIGRTVRALCGRRVSGALNVAEAREQCRESAQRSANEELARVLGDEQHEALAALSDARSND